MDDVILRRRTEKVLAERDLPVSDRRQSVNEILTLAGQAPFHRPCEDRHRQTGGLPGIEPWRFHVLAAAECRNLRAKVPLENAGKIPAMLAAADALIMATWLPNAGSLEAGSLEAGQFNPAEPQTIASQAADAAGFAATVTNMEHIAAAAAAIQNLLLAATARGISNYWSSGGVLRSQAMFELLGIPTTEILLGAVFLFPSERGEAELVTSKLRGRRTPPDQWSRWVSIS